MSTRSSQGLRIRIVEFIAKGLGTGWMPKAPGTWGSVLGLAFAYFLSLCTQPLIVHVGTILIFCIFSWWIIFLYEKDSGNHDDQQVTLDEVAGILITFIAIPMTLPNIAAGFFLFRFFDILKPFPIGWADREVPGAFGTLLDDLMAGAISCVLLHFIVYWV